jgi:hypothetical protein
MQELQSAYLDFDPLGVTLVTRLVGVVFVIGHQPIGFNFQPTLYRNGSTSTTIPLIN